MDDLGATSDDQMTKGNRNKMQMLNVIENLSLVLGHCLKIDQYEHCLSASGQALE